MPPEPLLQMLQLSEISLARTVDLFRYKKSGFALETFPGYTPDQWGIKAHNRPWIAEAAELSAGMKVMEVGGAYSLLPKYLAEHFKVEAWIGDDFGACKGDALWSRWGNPQELPGRYPSVRYVFQPFGKASSEYPDRYFDRIFTVSTLEHFPAEDIAPALKDIHRCLKPGGRELHSIDIPIGRPRECILDALVEKFGGIRLFKKRKWGGIRSWVEAFRQSGVRIAVKPPNPIQLLDRSVLVDSPDVVYRFYPPNNEPKAYSPAASLLLIIEDL
jgi:SAM-dependent methyltransferase